MKTSTAIKLSGKEAAMLQKAQDDGIARGVTLLSNLTFDRWDMGMRGLDAAVSVGTSTASFVKNPGGSDDTAGSLLGDEAESKINKLLSKAWDKARTKLENTPFLVKACDLLERGLSQLLGYVKGLIFNGKVLGMLVPFYGNVKGIIDGAIMAVDTHSQRTSIDQLKAMGPQVASGVPTVALASFTSYARAEYLRSAGKTAYTFVKSIGGLLAEIFSFGAWTVISFTAAVVEAIFSFVNSLIQGMLFDRTTVLFRDYVKNNTMPSPAQFRTILGGCSFVGCAFFASANYIGHFNLTSALSSPDRVLSTSTTMAAVAAVGDAQRMACGYSSSAAFKLACRPGGEQFKWVVDMMGGMADQSPKSEMLTENASKFVRFKYKAKRLFSRKK